MDIGSGGVVDDGTGLGAGQGGGARAIRRRGPADRPSENIALGPSYTLEPGPNYGLCTDPGDDAQLTDGMYTEGYFWTQPSTVGWQDKTPSILTLDLGTAMPVRGVSFSTAAGFADVRWPLTIRILVAGEDREFHEIGDLVQLSAQQHGPLAPTKASDAMWARDGMGFNEAEIHHHFDGRRDRYPPEPHPRSASADPSRPQRRARRPVWDAIGTGRTG